MLLTHGLSPQRCKAAGYWGTNVAFGGWRCKGWVHNGKLCQHRGRVNRFPARPSDSGGGGGSDSSCFPSTSLGTGYSRDYKPRGVKPAHCVEFCWSGHRLRGFEVEFGHDAELFGTVGLHELAAGRDGGGGGAFRQGHTPSLAQLRQAADELVPREN